LTGRSSTGKGVFYIIINQNMLAALHQPNNQDRGVTSTYCLVNYCI